MFYRAHTHNLDTNEWSFTDFEKRKDAILYINSQVKYPGEYNLKHTEGIWNDQACFFHDSEHRSGNGHYPKHRKGSIDFRRHWDFEKEKCAFEGFIIYKKPSENLEFAVPGLYYWYLNYCPIPDKLKAKEDFPEIYDGDYHYFLYILRCLLLRKFASVVKKRQSGYTLKNMAIILNMAWFLKAQVAKIFAIDKSKVEESWVFMEAYRDHINEHCGWTRGFDPGKRLNWHVRRKQTNGAYKGNNCQVKGFTTQQDPTSGIGGAAKIIYGEESGANDTLDITHEFITSNVSLGGITTGLVLYSGAVGKLDQAEPLKEFMIHPNDHGFLGCTNNIEDDIEYGSEVGFFVPEWWNYVSIEEDENGNTFGEAIKCYDRWGNTDKPRALSEIARHRKKAEQKSPEKYRYYCSQRPLSIHEAFATRKESLFPQKLIQTHKRRIEDKQYPLGEHCDIILNDKNKPELIKAHKSPITEFPLLKLSADKEGCIVIYERPFCEKPELGKFYAASIDPVQDVGKTTTSSSLFCILVYRLDTEVTRYGEQTEVFIDPGMIVAECTGRYDDPDKTYERAMLLMELYGAVGVCEVNVSAFVNFMLTKKRIHYIVPKSQLVFLKEAGSNTQSYQEYGWKNTGKLFENHLTQYIIDFLKEELSRKTHEDGAVISIKYGIERLGAAIMIIKELELYQLGMNVDRLIALAGLVSYVKVLYANRGYAKRVEEGQKKKVDPNLYAKKSSFFKTQQALDPKYQIQRSAFKNLK